MAETIQTKHCSHCKQIKPISEFSKVKSAKDGHHNQCKLCHNASNRKYNQSNKGLAYQKHYRRNYTQTENGKAKHRAKAKRYNARHPNKVKAKRAVNHAITAGKLPRPDTKLCHYCNKQARDYHHYISYELEHLFDVIPVCRKCHMRLHRPFEIIL